ATAANGTAYASTRGARAATASSPQLAEDRVDRAVLAVADPGRDLLAVRVHPDEGALEGDPVPLLQAGLAVVVDLQDLHAVGERARSDRLVERPALRTPRGVEEQDRGLVRRVGDEVRAVAAVGTWSGLCTRAAFAASRLGRRRTTLHARIGGRGRGLHACIGAAGRLLCRSRVF